MSLTYLQNKADLFRRLSIGIALGLIVIGLMTLIGGQSTSTPQKFEDSDLDIETVAVESMPEERDQNLEGVINPNNEKAKRYRFFARNKSPLSREQIDAITNGDPLMSVVVMNVGQQQSFIDHLIEKLPTDVTVGISPHLSSQSENATKLWDFGYETWMVMAAITLEVNHDHGNFALTPTNNFEYNMGLLEDQLGDKTYLTGLILPARALIKRSGKLWEDIVYDIFGQGYGLLDNTDGILKPSLYFYDDHRAPYLESDMAINDLLTLDMFRDILDNARQLSLNDNRYILTISASTPAHLDILSEWLNSLPNDGITLVPLSAQAQL